MTDDNDPRPLAPGLVLSGSRAALPATKDPYRGGLLGRLLTSFFSKVTVPADAAERLHDAHSRGTVVHVLRAHCVMDPLFILFALEKLGLPKPAWLHDHYASRAPDTAAAMLEAVRNGDPTLLFLRLPVTLTNPTSAYSERHVEQLVALQRTSDRPILLVPEALQWTKAAIGLRRTIIDIVFGDREAPGRIRELMGFFWHYQDSRYHVSAPVNLQAVIEREKGLPDRVIAKKVRWAILHHLAREDTLRTGPVQRSAARTRQIVLNDPSVRRYMQVHVKEAERAATEKRADELLAQIAADVRYGWVRFLDAIIDQIWNRIYDGIIVDAEGLARVRHAARRGPVVLVPSHKSHIDYLVLSQVFFKDGMMPPHVAAGENLSFWPLGLVFRRAGAFFLRRSFKGDKLYATVFAAYVRRVMKEGHALEFFIEGGRSRTGRLLPPKLGMLSMSVDPVLDGTVNDVEFIPVSISYEKIIEARSYQHELSGGAKKKEDVGALLSSTSVLRSKYGRVYVDFDEPISLRAFAAARGIEIKSRPELQDIAATDEPSPESRQLVTQLGHRIVYGINRVTRATPTSIAALVLLSTARRGLGEQELYARAERLLGFLRELDARQSSTLASETLRPAIREAIGRLAGDKLLSLVPSPDGDTIIRVGDDGRRALDYYKNNLLHFFVPYAIVATAVLVHGGRDVLENVVQAAAHRISKLLKYEFSFRDQDFDSNFRAASERLFARRTIERRDGDGGGDDAGAVALWSVTMNGRTEACELAGMLAVFFETYQLTAEEIAGQTTSIAEKKLAARVLLRAKKAVLEDKLGRPEGATQSSIETALRWLVEETVLARSGEGLTLASEDKRAAVVEELGGYLARLVE
jgi:glycerol-3-phosphate O-acyltransferase